MKKNDLHFPSRRNFLKNTARGSAIFLLDPGYRSAENNKESEIPLPEKLESLDGYTKTLNLSPAKWIWFPSQRTLANTIFQFRKSVIINKEVKEAKGWILGESRYQLFANGKRVQFGPAPNDPRYSEADPLELTAFLKEGENIFGAEILYYGHGDGTWPIGKPGFIFKLDIFFNDGSGLQVISDESWDCLMPRSWKPGQYKRWYLRSFQEEFDANFYPYEWTSHQYYTDHFWCNAMVLNNRPDLPALCSTYEEYMYDIQGKPAICELRERNIPLIREIDYQTSKLSEKKQIKWLKSPEEYFQVVTPDAYMVIKDLTIDQPNDHVWSFMCERESAVLLTFELEEQMVGFPFFTIDAPAGTVIEMMVQEGHATGAEHPLMNNHFHSWTRFTCKEGINYFQTFDFESFRWMQLHIRNVEGPINVSELGIKRRMYDWSNKPDISIGDNKLQKVINASINTIYNAAQETIVDGMGRERQQYSGDVGHQLHALFYTFGETKLPARYLNTFSQGLTHDGYFLDSWPAYDRLARLCERQLNLTQWGPILDHSVGFNFDSYYYYLYTGNLHALKEVYPRLLVFSNYLKKLQDPSDGLLPVENIGIPYVWIDHNAYQKQKHKQCAFNLYASAMLQYALAPLCEAMEDEVNKKEAMVLSKSLHKAVMCHFYSDTQQILIVNKPWLAEESGPRYCDRSLATAVMFDQIPPDAIINAIRTLADAPASMGLSYPANAGWRYWALAKGGRMDVVINEIRNKWASLDSVNLNNTLQEDWAVQPDSNSQWSHCPVAPLYMLYMGILGLHPLKPGFEEMSIRPQLADIKSLKIMAHTVRGPILFESMGVVGKRKLIIKLPKSTKGYLTLDAREKVKLPETDLSDQSLRQYEISGGKEISLKLKYT